MSKEEYSKEWMTIPVLPCISVEETLSFWENLGFEITYKQTRPYQYGVVKRGAYALHFAKVKGVDASNNFSCCLIMVYDAEKAYQEFREQLKQNFGKVPHSGVPRISRKKPGTTRFTLTDISGNSIIFISYGEADQETWEKADDKNQTPLQKAIATAIRFRDYKEDLKAAAVTLDVALRKSENAPPAHIADALAMRMDLAEVMNDPVREAECRKLLKQLELKKDEATAIKNKHQVEF